jgi:hypothetical protein
MEYQKSRLSLTTWGKTEENIIPKKMPLINMLAANIAAVEAYCGATVCGVYIMPSELVKKMYKIIY